MQFALAHAKVDQPNPYEHTQIEVMFELGRKRVVTFRTVALHRFDGNVLRIFVGPAQQKCGKMDMCDIVELCVMSRFQTSCDVCK